MTIFIAGCATHPVREGVETGLASYYASSLEGYKTASGERYHQKLFTAAHRTLPFGTRIEVRNKANGRTVDVRVNDRGPFVDSRIIDLSYAAAKALGIIQSGVADVEIHVLTQASRTGERGA